MFSKILTLMLVTSPLAFANLSPQDLKDRLEIRADVYIVDGGGKVISGPERTVSWRMDAEKGELKGDWSSSFDKGLMALRHKWQVMDDGSIKVSIEEYGQAENKKNQDGPEFRKLLERKEFAVENLQPVVWKVKNIKDYNFVVRYIPSLRELRKPIAVESLPLAGTGISISDNAGYLWAEGIEFNGKYSGVTTHRGTLALSYVPFKGAKEVGYAEGNKITLNFEKKYQVNLKGTTSFLPAGVTAKVYAVYKPGKTSKGVNSVGSFDTNKEDRLEKALQ